MKLYRIAEWAKYYEVSDSKKVEGPLTWVPVRIKTDGFGFLRITQESNRTDLLAAWLLMLGIAAKQSKADRGKLSRNGIPLSPKDMELMTRFPAQIFAKALEFFSDPQQGWIVSEEVRIASDKSGRNHKSSGDDPQPSESSGSTGQDRTGQTGQDNCAGKPARRANPLFDALVEFEQLPETFNTAEGAKIGRALKLIREASPNVTAEEISRRGSAYVAQYRVKPTAMGLASNWSKFEVPTEIEGMPAAIDWRADGRL